MAEFALPLVNEIRDDPSVGPTDRPLSCAAPPLASIPEREACEREGSLAAGPTNGAASAAAASWAARTRSDDVLALSDLEPPASEASHMPEKA